MNRINMETQKGLQAYKKADDDSISIWRYMDFTKLVFMLEKKAMFFIRGDMLPDPFEGSFPIPTVESRPIRYKSLSAEHLKRLSHGLKHSRKLAYINCWHIGDHESAAMWKLYLKSDEGIAIKSTTKRLNECFDSTTDKRLITTGRVRYINYDLEQISEGNLLFPFFHKRMSFQHENEYRAVIIHVAPEFITDKRDEKGNAEIELTREVKNPGLYVSVSLDTLIDSIYVCPSAEEWFYELIRLVVSRYALNKEVKKSDLTRDPVY